GNYVDNYFLPEAEKSRYLWSGTDYASALKLIMKDGGGKGFFGFGAKKPEPTYVMFITDGDTENERESEKLLAEFEKQNTYV
ncbi:VWA domain-containing protein, partial [Klebsiella pneumoniae]|nr:VWA domain-containing protein [Klebsiella pneumoniae]